MAHAPGLRYRCFAIAACVIIHAIAWVELQLPGNATRLSGGRRDPASGILLLSPDKPPAKQVPLDRPPATAAARRLNSVHLPLAETSRSLPVELAPAMTQLPPADSAEAPASGDSGPAIDIEAFKKSVRKDVAGTQEKNRPGKAIAAQDPDNPKPLPARPKCDEKYIPKIGSVGFDGLLKLPFLVKDAVTGTGCKF
jgi:hypothetical protein